MVDITLIGARLADIDANPDSWHQADWINDCGTAGCIAGLQAIADSNAGLIELRPLDAWPVNSTGPGFHESIAAHARRRFGLTEVQALSLFFGLNKRCCLQALRDALAVDPDDDLRDVFGDHYNAGHPSGVVV